MPYIVKSFPNQTVSSSGPNAASSGIALLDDCTAIAFYAPVLTASALIVQVEPSDTGTSWANLQTGTANVILNSTSCVIVNPGGFRQMRVITTSTEAAARTITVVGQLAV